MPDTGGAPLTAVSVFRRDKPAPSHTFPGRILQAVAGRHKLEAATYCGALPGSRSSSRLFQPESPGTL